MTSGDATVLIRNSPNLSAFHVYIDDSELDDFKIYQATLGATLKEMFNHRKLLTIQSGIHSQEGFDHNTNLLLLWNSSFHEYHHG